MNDFISKISSYNIFNNLVPGAIFAYILNDLSIYKVDSPSTIVDIVMYYFLGMVVSRIGSIFIEPVLKYISFVKYSDYSNFIIATSKDAKIETLLEANNLYRSISAVFITSLAAYFIKYAAQHYQWSQRSLELGVIIFLVALFLLAYRKQTAYIRNRVEHHTRGS